MPRVLLPSLLSLLLLASACGGDNAAPAEKPERRAAATLTPSPSRVTSPTTSPEPAPTQQPAAREKKGDGRGRKLAPQTLMARADASAEHLLEAGALPRIDGQEWTVRTTEDEGSQPVGACQQTPLADIGALQAVRRSFSGPDRSGLAAHQVVGRFADPRSAWRAHEVLRAWRDDCAERLDGRAAAVGDMEEVALISGEGGHYRTTSGSRRHAAVAGIGIVRVGRWLSVVELSSAQDDYPTGWHPPRRAVRRIAATFA